MSASVAASRGRVDEAVFAAIGLSWAAGVIHVAASTWHAAEYLPFAVAFALVAGLQFAWGGALYLEPSPRLRAAGVALSLGLVAVWLVSRTVGLPLGPAPWQPEPWGIADILASADELLLCVLVLTSVPAQLRRPAVIVAVALISLSSLTFMLGEHAH